MKIAGGLLALLFATSAFAQSDPPKASKKPTTQARPTVRMGRKLVGSVKRTLRLTSFYELRGLHSNCPGAERCAIDLKV